MAEPFPGLDVGDIPDKFYAWFVGSEVALHLISDRVGVVVSDRGGSPCAGLTCSQAEGSHEVPDELWSAGHVLSGQFGADASIAVGFPRGGEDSRDFCFQHYSTFVGGRVWPVPPVVVAGLGDANLRTHAHDGVVRLLAIDELELGVYRYS
jgi:hypothetical protein